MLCARRIAFHCLPLPLTSLFKKKQRTNDVSARKPNTRYCEEGEGMVTRDLLRRAFALLLMRVLMASKMMRSRSGS